MAASHAEQIVPEPRVTGWRRIDRLSEPATLVALRSPACPATAHRSVGSERGVRLNELGSHQIGALLELEQWSHVPCDHPE